MNKVTLYPDKRLTAWGFRYLLFQLLVLPMVLNWLNLLLSLPLDESKINLLYYTINFAVLVAIFWRFLGASLQHAQEYLSHVLVAAVVGFFLARFSSTVLDLAIYAIFPDFFNVNDANIATMAQSQMPMWAFATIVLVPPVEELLFRGALFGGLYSRSKVLAWVVSVLSFSLVHVLGYVGVYTWDVLLICFVQYLPAGIFLADAYRRSGNILAPIAIHTVVNASAMISMAMI